MTIEDNTYEEQSGIFPQNRMQDIIQEEMRKQQANLPSMRSPTTHTTSLPPLFDPASLNWNEGFAQCTLQRLVGHEALEQARSENDEHRRKGKDLREIFGNLKRFTAGHLIKGAGTHELGCSLLNEMQKREQLDKLKQEEKERKKQNTHLHHINLFRSLLFKKPEESTWNLKDYKTAINATCVDSDKFCIPTLKQDVIQLWNTTLSHRARDLLPLQPERNSPNTNTTSTAPPPTQTPPTMNNEKKMHNETSTNQNSMDKEILPVPFVVDDADESKMIGLASVCTDFMSETFGEAV